MEPAITIRMTTAQFRTISGLLQECAVSDEETNCASAFEVIEETRLEAADITGPDVVKMEG